MKSPLWCFPIIDAFRTQLKSVNYFRKSSLLDVKMGSEYASGNVIYCVEYNSNIQKHYTKK